MVMRGASGGGMMPMSGGGTSDGSQIVSKSTRTQTITENGVRTLLFAFFCSKLQVSG